MKNYRRHSGDGSVKVVLSGDSNSPPKTTGRREPSSYNSSSTQELRTSILVGGGDDVRSLTSSADQIDGYPVPEPNVDSRPRSASCSSSSGVSALPAPPWPKSRVSHLAFRISSAFALRSA